MKKLINVLKEMHQVLFLLEEIINEEYTNLSNSPINIKTLSLTIEKKKFLLKKLSYLKKMQSYFESKNNIHAPYLNCNELNFYFNKVIKKCRLLNKINFTNKKIIKHKFYLNQKFLNLYKSYKKNNIYNIEEN